MKSHPRGSFCLCKAGEHLRQRGSLSSPGRSKGLSEQQWVLILIAGVSKSQSRVTVYEDKGNTMLNYRRSEDVVRAWEEGGGGWSAPSDRRPARREIRALVYVTSLLGKFTSESWVQSSTIPRPSTLIGCPGALQPGSDARHRHPVSTSRC